MSVYVDLTRNRFRGMVMCHMVADTIDELHAMADKIGLKREWFQPGKPTTGSLPHYDVSQSKREEALLAGALEIERTELVQMIRKYRAAAAR